MNQKNSYFYTDVTRIGNIIHCIGYLNGKKFHNQYKFKPTFYLFTNEQSKWKSIKGKYLSPMTFDSMSDATDFIKKYRGVANFDFCGQERYEYQFIAEEFAGDKLNPDLDSLVILYLDTEVDASNGFPSIEKAENEFTVITARYKNNYYVFGCKDYETDRTDVKYIKCLDERHLLTKFLAFWDMIRPDIVTGWNVAQFDIAYLIRRLEKVLGSEAVKKLSPYNRVNEKKFTGRFGKEQIEYDILGVTVYDYIDIYKKFSTKQQESYKLDHVANDELGVKKLDYSEYGNLTRLYNENFKLYTDYNIRDTELVWKLEQKKKLIEQALRLAYSARCNLPDVFKQTVMWDCILYSYLLKQNIVVSSKKQTTFREFPGAYVMEPKLGMYDWVVTFDLNSLYPSLIMHYNMGPDTYLNEEDLSQRISQETDPEKKKSLQHLLSFMDDGRINLNYMAGDHVSLNVIGEIKNEHKEHLVRCGLSLAPNGALFDTSKDGFMAVLLEDMYRNRSEYKNKSNDLFNEIESNANLSDKEKSERKLLALLYNNIQAVLKVQLNSLYGSLGNEGFRFFLVNIAEAITTGGQLTIQWAKMKLNELMNNALNTKDVEYVIYGDTDSIALHMGPLVEKFKEKLQTKEKTVDFLDKYAEKIIQPYLDKIFEELRDAMNAPRQKMKMKREKICDHMIYTAKKRYIANVLDEENVRYAQPKISVTGIESKRTSVPKVCRDALNEAYKIIMQNDPDKLREFVEEFKKKYCEMSFEDIAFPRSANNLLDYADRTTIYKKGTPIHVRAVLLHNHYLQKLNLTNTYEEIKEGEKIKFAYLTVPNKINENVIACISFLPKEFNLTDSIDYNMMFEKSFFHPLKNVTDVIGWNIEERSALEAFF